MDSQCRLGQSTVQGRKVLNRLKLMSSKRKVVEKYKVLDFLQQQLETSPLRAFTFEELSAATQGFDRSLFLGEGGFGEVYKGYLIDHSTQESGASTYQHIAVKRLHKCRLQGHREWLNEVSFCGRLHHPNVARLIGFCAQLTKIQEECLLVYEFVLHGSLENLLFQTSNFWLPMPWNRQVDVAVEVASGLAFLHDQQVLGTWEYVATEYIQTGHLTLQSDIWSFGILLLELLSGRRAMDRRRPPEEQNLVVWARPFLHQRTVNCLIDPQLYDRYSIEEAKVVLDFVQQCLKTNPKSRPTMKEILQILSSLKESESKDIKVKLINGLAEITET